MAFVSNRMRARRVDLISSLHCSLLPGCVTAVAMSSAWPCPLVCCLLDPAAAADVENFFFHSCRYWHRTAYLCIHQKRTGGSWYTSILAWSAIIQSGQWQEADCSVMMAYLNFCHQWPFILSNHAHTRFDGVRSKMVKLFKSHNFPHGCKFCLPVIARNKCILLCSHRFCNQKTWILPLWHIPLQLSSVHCACRTSWTHQNHNQGWILCAQAP